MKRGIKGGRDERSSLILCDIYWGLFTVFRDLSYNNSDIVKKFIFFIIGKLDSHNSDNFQSSLLSQIPQTPSGKTG